VGAYSMTRIQCLLKFVLTFHFDPISTLKIHLSLPFLNKHFE
jgi:hypothetical protein